MKQQKYREIMNNFMWFVGYLLSFGFCGGLIWYAYTNFYVNVIFKYHPVLDWFFMFIIVLVASYILKDCLNIINILFSGNHHSLIHK